MAPWPLRRSWGGPEEGARPGHCLREVGGNNMPPPQWSAKPSGDKVTAFTASGRPVWRLPPLERGPGPGGRFCTSSHRSSFPVASSCLSLGSVFTRSPPAPLALSWSEDSKLRGWRCPEKWPGISRLHTELRTAQHGGPGAGSSSRLGSPLVSPHIPPCSTHGPMLSALRPGMLLPREGRAAPSHGNPSLPPHSPRSHGNE